MRNPAAEDRTGCRCHFVHVRVKCVTGEMGKMLDVLKSDRAGCCLQRITELKLFEPLAERVGGRFRLRCSRNPLANYITQTARMAL